MNKPRRRTHTRTDTMLPFLTDLSSDWLVWSPPSTPIGCFWITSAAASLNQGTRSSARYTTSARSLCSQRLSSRYWRKIEEFGYSSRFDIVTEKVSFNIWKWLTVIQSDSDRWTFSVCSGPTGKKLLSHLTSTCTLYWILNFTIIAWLIWFTNIGPE